MKEVPPNDGHYYFHMFLNTYMAQNTFVILTKQVIYHFLATHKEFRYNQLQRSKKRRKLQGIKLAITFSLGIFVKEYGLLCLFCFFSAFVSLAETTLWDSGFGEPASLRFSLP